MTFDGESARHSVRPQRTAPSSRQAPIQPVYGMDLLARHGAHVHVVFLRGVPPVTAVVEEFPFVPRLVSADLGRLRKHPAPLGRAELGGVRDRLDGDRGGKGHPSCLRWLINVAIERCGAGAGLVRVEGRAAGNADEAGHRQSRDILSKGIEEPMLRFNRRLPPTPGQLLSRVIFALEGLGRDVVSGEELRVRGWHGKHHHGVGVVVVTVAGVTAVVVAGERHGHGEVFDFGSAPDSISKRAAIRGGLKGQHCE